MKVAYFDCFSGASGDMILGAMLDAGLSMKRLKEQLAALGLPCFDLKAVKVLKQGVGASRVLITMDQDAPHRTLSDIRHIIEKSTLDSGIKENGLNIFNRLAEAEACIHQVRTEEIHFHEVGAMDAIIDAVGASIGLYELGIESVHCSPMNVGCGTVTCAHGVLPVPAPATAELIKGKPIYAAGPPGELLTPTGAAILTTLAKTFGSMPEMTVASIGYGAGSADRVLPNVLRLFIGTTGAPDAGYEMDQTAILETTIDDMNPQIFDYLIDEVFKLNALDIFFYPVQMKKNRSGFLLSVLCPPHNVHQIADLIFSQTTTIGLRWRIENRIKLSRKIVLVDTPYGKVRCKAAFHGQEAVNVAPEYDDCKIIALRERIPLKKVMETVRAEALKYDPFL